MAKRFFAFVLAAAAAAALYSCAGDPITGAAYRGTDELGAGAQTPFALEQNEPNPFDVSTMIRFRAGQPMHLSLKVYSADWQEVSVILDTTVPAGSYLTTCNAASFSIGDYYYVLDGGGYREVRKMRVIR